MCNDLNINLPTLGSFLLLYSLRTGCFVILIWTLLRSFSVLLFFIITMVIIFLPKKSPDDGHNFFVFIGHLVMVVTESFLFIFTIILGSGLYCCKPYHIGQYLICRFLCWISETTLLSILCLGHHHLIGWYLAFLMVIILEFYNFVVVYSYYMDLIEEPEEKGFEENVCVVERPTVKCKSVSILYEDCVCPDSDTSMYKEMLCSSI